MPRLRPFSKPSRQNSSGDKTGQRVVRQRLPSSSTSMASITHDGATHIWAKQAKVPAIRRIVGKRSGGGISPLAFEAKVA
jgi:hypothetical protein